MQIRLINEHLFCKYFVRQSVGQTTNGRNVKIKKHEFLDGYITILLIDAHLFYEYSVRQSVGQATNAEIKKHDFLCSYLRQRGLILFFCENSSY